MVLRGRSYQGPHFLGVTLFLGVTVIKDLVFQGLCFLG